MTGMQRKAARRALARQYTADGLPRDARNWWPEDWASLHRHLEAARREIAERHKEEGDGTQADH
jgi:hypothetical protein